jgi:hypothetical protein
MSSAAPSLSRSHGPLLMRCRELRPPDPAPENPALMSSRCAERLREWILHRQAVGRFEAPEV